MRGIGRDRKRDERGKARGRRERDIGRGETDRQIPCNIERINRS